MPHYYTDHRQFTNPFAMFAYAATNTPHTYPTFDFYDKEFSQLNWKVEPQESLESLMETRARQLREKYERLVLFFSGGTDSITIFRIFKKLNLRLDEIVITYHEDPMMGHSTECVQWLIDNIYDPTILITALSRDGQPSYYDSLTDDFLVSENFNFCFTPFKGTRESMNLIMDTPRFKNSNSAIIQGLEKPHIMFKGNKWYTAHLDKVYVPFLGSNHIEWFYVSPDLPALHIKQTHMMKNYAKQFVKPTSDWISSIFGDKSPETLALLGKWTGRDPNISKQNAKVQKFWHHLNSFNIAETIIQRRERVEGSIFFDTPQFKNYIKGMTAIQVDGTLEEYMRRMSLRHPSGNLDKYHGIYSKMIEIE